MTQESDEMPDESTELSNSRVLLQQDARAQVCAAVDELNRRLSLASDLGLQVEVDVHHRRRMTGRTEDGEMNDISVGVGDAATPVIGVSFADHSPPASVIAMRKS